LKDVDEAPGGFIQISVIFAKFNHTFIKSELKHQSEASATVSRRSDATALRRNGQSKVADAAGIFVRGTSDAHESLTQLDGRINYAKCLPADVAIHSGEDERRGRPRERIAERFCRELVVRLLYIGEGEEDTRAGTKEGKSCPSFRGQFTTKPLSTMSARRIGRAILLRAKLFMRLRRESALLLMLIFFTSITN
jgi:hypothetical protein